MKARTLGGHRGKSKRQEGSTKKEVLKRVPEGSEMLGAVRNVLKDKYMGMGMK